MKNFVIFKLYMTEKLSIEHPENILLLDIIEKVEGKGIKCSEIKKGSFCIATLCKLQFCLVAIVLLPL
jgi:hypothetical protein